MAFMTTARIRAKFPLEKCKPLKIFLKRVLDFSLLEIADFGSDQILIGSDEDISSKIVLGLIIIFNSVRIKPAINVNSKVILKSTNLELIWRILMSQNTWILL